MSISWLPKYRVEIYKPEIEIWVDSFHPVLAIGGWMLTIFYVLHFYPPFFNVKNKKQGMPNQPLTRWAIKPAPLFRDAL